MVGEELPEAGVRQYFLTLPRAAGSRIELHIEAELSHGEDPFLDVVVTVHCAATTCLTENYGIGQV
ncbi:hypothetical protein Mth01_29080 [Sphaerimonospora thailandensis]|uniref:Uncharacterized protein n=1 Tax=Sphaerimonospora thailandensis TaxID=795644 RepID=A0A8J3W004_9ACTN|nr:hypothetical protein Mth01_29080 [Sphaerimonospora thailandensis]